MAQASVLPFRLGKALNYHYRISTGKFNRAPYVNNVDNDDPDYDDENDIRSRGCKYTADLAVGQHPEYPDIPPSTWTLEITIPEGEGVEYCVKPKEEAESLKQANVVLMDWRVRLGWEVGENVAAWDACKGRLGPDGWDLGSSEPITVTQAFDFTGEKCHCVNGEIVLVSLTFVVQKSVRHDLEKLLDSGLLSDCKLVCGEQEFLVHRAILAAQSPVFEALFQTDMKEKSSGIVEINDISPDVLEILLKYIYTRDLAKADVDLIDLWTAADKYDLDDLKSECERLMPGSVTDANAVQYLVFAAEQGMGVLKVEAAKIISQQPT